MKTVKTTTCFVFGLFLALLDSACFNPNSIISSPARESVADIPAYIAGFNDIDPFTVTIAVDGSARSIAGLKRDRLRAGTGVRNFAQLIALDTASRKIMGFAEIHQTDPGDWRIAYTGNPVDTAFDLAGGKVPAWIIRNGVNDEAPDQCTNFKNFGTDSNANGTVRFVVGAEAGTPIPAVPNDSLKITGGVFENPGNEKPSGYIGFTTGGYADTAEVYYAVVAHGSGSPALPAYGYLGSRAAGTHAGQKISLEDAGGTVHTNADVYVLLIKKGLISALFVIWTDPANTGWGWGWGWDGTGIPVTGISMTSAAQTTENAPLILTGTVSPNPGTWRNIAWEVSNAGATRASIHRSGNTYTLIASAGGTVTVRATVPHAVWEGSQDYADFNIEVGIDWTGGSYCSAYKTWYVASNGSDDAAGTAGAPLKTVDKALEKTKTAHTKEKSSWPLNRPAEIHILNTVTVKTRITIDNTGNIYPPIRLTGSTLVDALGSTDLFNRE
jgi:hypothetical protein